MAPTSATHTAPRWTWAAVERGLWAGQLDPEFAGLIEQEIVHGYSPTDHTGHPLGTYPTLLDAKSALRAAHPDGVNP
jgi:hypothetical protein